MEYFRLQNPDDLESEKEKSLLEGNDTDSHESSPIKSRHDQYYNSSESSSNQNALESRTQNALESHTEIPTTEDPDSDVNSPKKSAARISGSIQALMSKLHLVRVSDNNNIQSENNR